MQLLSALFGVTASGGSTSGSTTGTSTGTAADTKTPTYTPGQVQGQAGLSQLFQALLPSLSSGGVSPNVQAVQTAGADQINKTSSGLIDRTNRYLAQRGFGASGSTGKVALQGELGRESALGANASAASGLQLQQNNTTLADLLQFAFSNPGQATTSTATGSTSGTSDSSGFGVGIGAQGAFKPS